MSGEKPYAPTQRKLRKARLQGDVARSRLLTFGAGVIGGGVGAYFIREGEISSLFLMASELSQDPSLNNIQVILKRAFFAWCVLFGAVGGTAGVAVLLSEVLQLQGVSFLYSGPRLSWRAVFSPLPPEKGGEGLLLGCGWRILMMTLWFIVAITGGPYLWKFAQASAFLHLSETGIVWQLSLLGGVFATGLFCLIAGIFSLLWHIWLRRKRLSMDREELKRELRDAHGDPLQSWVRRQLHQELVVHGAIETIRKSKVVVTGELGREERKRM